MFSWKLPPLSFVRDLAENLPRPGSVDRLAVNGEPICQLPQLLLNFRIQRAVRTLHDVQEQVAVLGNDVDEHVDRPADRPVVPVLVVEPIADRRVGLPGQGWMSFSTPRSMS